MRWAIESRRGRLGIGEDRLVVAQRHLHSEVKFAGERAAGIAAVSRLGRPVEAPLDHDRVTGDRGHRLLGVVGAAPAAELSRRPDGTSISSSRSAPTAAIALSSSAAHGITLNAEQPASI